MIYVGIPLLLLGLVMMTRGWIYTFWPNGKMAEKRKRRNLKVGFTTDMKLFGRKVRRLGLIITIVGSAILGWDLSLRREAAAAQAQAAMDEVKSEIREAAPPAPAPAPPVQAP